MDLKYNLTRAWLLRDRSPLPVTTLELIKDSPEFVTLASSEHLEMLYFFFFLLPLPSHTHSKGTACVRLKSILLHNMSSGCRVSLLFCGNFP